MKKKIIVTAAFSILILITVIVFSAWVMQALNYDMYSNNKFDIGEGVGALILMYVGGMVVCYELDLFYTIYYFLVKPKTKIKSILNILSNLSLILVFVYTFLSDGLMWVLTGEVIPIGLFLIYGILRIVYFIVSIILRFNKNQ